MDKNLVMRELQKPFKEEEIEWRVGATNKDKTMGLALPYVTNKAIQNRLDEVFGVFGWKNEFKEWKGNSQLCGISIWDEDKNEWLTKYDGADDTTMESTKGGLSDAMKRAAVQFGIGRYLYKLDPIWVPLKDGKYLDFIPQLPVWALPYEEQERITREINTPPEIDESIVNTRVSDIKTKYSNDADANSNGNNTAKGKTGSTKNSIPKNEQVSQSKVDAKVDTNANAKSNKANASADEPVEVKPERPKNLISDKQINLFNIRAKNKSRNKVYEILGKFGYTSVDTIEKKNFNNILYYIDQLQPVRAMA